MASPTLNDTELEKEYGRRNLPVGSVIFDQPGDLGYQCPFGHTGDWLSFSEFKDHIWCYKCKMDYHYAADCQLRRMCWMSDNQWRDFIARLPMKPQVIEGIQHFPDCEIPHEVESEL